MYSLVIADDEIIEQKVLQKIVHDFCPSVYLLPCVSNGAELLSCIEQECPDIIVLDINMPVLNGLDVLEWIRLKNISSKILIVSAYSKFQYAQKSINMGADGYILKPVNERVFVEAIQKLCIDLEKEKKENTERGNLETLKTEYKKVLENEIISDLLLEEVHSVSIKKYTEYLHHSFLGGGTCIIKVKGTTTSSKELPVEQILLELTKFCTCFWKEYKNFWAICFLIDSTEQSENYEQWIEELFGYVKKKNPFLPWENLIVGISSFKNSFEQFPAAMKESRISTQGKETAGFYPYLQPKESAEEYSFHKEFYECRYLFSFSPIEENRKKMDYYIQKITNKLNDIYFIRIFAFTLLCTVYQKSQENTIFFGAYSCLDAWSSLMNLNDAEEIFEFVCKQNQMQKLSETSVCDPNPHVEKCIPYLERHYQERISLETVAENMGISSFYLSRLFKQERGKTFVEFLTDIRILAALDKMWQTNDSFQKITEQVGYDNVSYFYKLFKKNMGISVSEMRRDLKESYSKFF